MLLTAFSLSRLGTARATLETERNYSTALRVSRDRVWAISRTAFADAYARCGVATAPRKQEGCRGTTRNSFLPLMSWICGGSTNHFSANFPSIRPHRSPAQVPASPSYPHKPHRRHSEPSSAAEGSAPNHHASEILNHESD